MFSSGRCRKLTRNLYQISTTCHHDRQSTSEHPLPDFASDGAADLIVERQRVLHLALGQKHIGHVKVPACTTQPRERHEKARCVSTNLPAVSMCSGPLSRELRGVRANTGVSTNHHTVSPSIHRRKAQTKKRRDIAPVVDVVGQLLERAPHSRLACSHTNTQEPPRPGSAKGIRNDQASIAEHGTRREDHRKEGQGLLAKGDQ